MQYQIVKDVPVELRAPVKVLDQGYMEYVEHWGSDERIIEAARMSNGKGFLGWDAGPCEACNGSGRVAGDVVVWDSVPEVRVMGGRKSLYSGFRHSERREVACFTCSGTGKLAGDAKLLKFLYSNKHATPFEMAGMTITCQAPIMVYREWHRHRTQSYAEMSARYTPMPDVNYVPTAERCMVVVGKNKQAGVVAGSDELTHEIALEWLGLLEQGYAISETIYQRGLKIGIPKELARLIVPVGRYSRMMASTDLRNWLAFLTLRMDKGAQWEIRQYANQVGRYIKAIYPRTWELFVEGKEYAT